MRYTDIYLLLLLGDMLHCSISPIEFVRILFWLFLLSVWILGRWYLKNRINNHVEIFTVSLLLSGIARLTLKGPGFFVYLKSGGGGADSAPPSDLGRGATKNSEILHVRRVSQ